ncbi:MAG: ABC transporter ATP-binding protein [Methanocalculus sp. MSAO_Arc1]|uniref:energy-coupling factor ABC transporter ATP-binding protein n=1 Tax=Methanocalculus TaxID=71151 RepID=UPI000FF11613|nr:MULTISPECIES: ABC transporter ATP-binding protein [unclassified Methanocalculus]MCP1662410.1 cobalt/nickel transport system ATP-binding protein [Methanocalculus sp. AMF5]RQD79475.1 MAG: ABC transporter ATP-binding protein [Methanocalculus sp. MSAO_Arc1]
MKEAVTIENLHHHYPDGTVSLKEISLTVHEGERLAIIGQNGAGKTTLFLHLNGSIKSMEDNVHIFGQNVRHMKIEERIQKVGVVFQDPDDQLFMPTLYDDVAFGPTNMGLSREDVDRRVREALETVGLTGFEDRVPHHMSYGEKKRAALAAVLSMEPRILILDEPTANLDPKNRALLIQLINRLNQEKGITTIVAMHDVNAVSQMADRVVVLNTTIVADGKPNSIFSDGDLLKKNNLEAPEVYKLFRIMECYGYCCSDHPPLAAHDAPGAFDTSLMANGGAITLKRHQRTEEELLNLLANFEY